MNLAGGLAMAVHNSEEDGKNRLHLIVASRPWVGIDEIRFDRGYVDLHTGLMTFLEASQVALGHI